MSTEESKTPAAAAAKKRIVLIGGGHAHVQVIKGLHTRFRPGAVEVVLIDKNDTAFYSGMMPGCVAGLYTGPETHIQLAPLAKWAGIEFINDTVTSINAEAKTVTLEGGRTVNYDVVSLDIGSRTLGTYDVPGVHKFAVTTRPINELLDKVQTEEEVLSKAGRDKPVKVAVVGGGAAGVELALAVQARWSKLFPVEVTLLHSGEVVFGDQPPMAREEVMRQLGARGVKCLTSAFAVKLEDGKVVLRDSREVEFDRALWATGAEPHALSQDGSLELETTRGFFTVNEYLQSTSSPFVFGGGDCIHMASAPMPKAGVYAVRAGPILLNNLVAQALGGSLKAYKPQSDFLRLLCTGDGNAIGAKFGLAFYGEWVWGLKDWIDRSFMKLFDPDLLPSDKQLDELEASRGKQYDAGFGADASADLTAAQAAAVLNERTEATADSDPAKSFARQHAVLKRMAADEEFMTAVSSEFRALAAERTAASADSAATGTGSETAGAGAGAAGAGSAAP